ncbi:Hypothetical predicted protein [Olea europaea subsp. europaea]|uniref:Uncharacterized protein n=1 Tax=Olea europaea subsp. europaea TaxID=158383 RepID=A0A8S0PIU9_OLEEU|nr:Hypothetical predicted protein [Olea europaea subsp. europaea]
MTCVVRLVTECATVYLQQKTLFQMSCLVIFAVVNLASAEIVVVFFVVRLSKWSLEEYKMSALPNLYEKFVKLINYLMENKQEDRD